MCLSAQGQFGWSSEQPGLVEWEELWGPFHPTHSVVPWKCLFSPLGKYKEKTELHEEENQNLLRFLEYFAQQSSGRTVRNFHCSVNYSRNSFVSETQRKNWVCHFSFGLLCLFCHYFLCFQLTLIPKKRNKLETTLCLVLQWKSELQV